MEDDVQTLLELGLTHRQAKVFYILLESNALTVRELATTSKMARQDIYKVLFELQQRGLIEKQIQLPTKYAAIPIEDAFATLLRCRVQKTSFLTAKTKQIIKRHDGRKTKNAYDEEPKIVVIPEKNDIVLRLKKITDHAQDNIDVFSPRKTVLHALFLLHDELNEAIGRGVKIRVMTDRFELAPQEPILTFLKNPDLEIRSTKIHSNTRFCIYDKKEVSVVLSPTRVISKSYLLWSNCPSIVSTYNEFFEMMWCTGVQVTQQINKLKEETFPKKCSSEHSFN